MKICIVGAGAIGGYLGFKLIKEGLDVSLVARGAHLEAMKIKGLTIIENEKESVCFPKCSEDMEELGKMDFIFITLKAYSIPGVVKEIVKMFDERFYRMWEFYLLASKYSFVNMGNIVFQLVQYKAILNSKYHLNIEVK